MGVPPSFFRERLLHPDPSPRRARNNGPPFMCRTREGRGSSIAADMRNKSDKRCVGGYRSINRRAEIRSKGRGFVRSEVPLSGRAIISSASLEYPIYVDTLN